MRFMPLALLSAIVFALGACTANPRVSRTEVAGRPADLSFRIGQDTDQPLILALHGSSGNSIQFQVQSDLLGAATRAGYRVALMNGQLLNGPTYYGQTRSWNAGACCWSRPESDVDYLSRAIAQMQVGATGKGRKVIVVGHSNGSMMAYALMCARPGLIDAAVGIAGTIAVTSCAPSDTKVIHIHGDSDPTVPLAGDQDLSDGEENFYSLDFQRSLFSQNGIDQQTFIVKGAGHAISSIDGGLRAQTGRSISDLALSLLD